MKKLAVIGDPINHSLSPRMHQAAIQALKISATYEALHIPQGQISLIKKYQKEFIGFNVTIPHKKSVMKYVDQLTPAAKEIGAVNTLYLKNKKWIGDNTDAPGFLLSLKKNFPNQKIKGTYAVVFGAGGSAYAVVYGLLKSGISKIYLVNRTKSNAMALIKKMGKLGKKVKYLDPQNDLVLQFALVASKWVINTTSLGMGKLKKLSPLAKGIKLYPQHCVMDLIYNPAQTIFLKQAQKAGAQTGNGLWMLVFQGALAFQKFLNRRPNVQRMFRAIQK